MSQEPVCEFRVVTQPGQANLCKLGRFDGQVTDGMCRRCIRDGLNSTHPLTFAERAKNFAVASAKHIAAGLPMASEEEIARRFAICQACEFYKDGACQKCGCPVVREKKFISKLAWADQSCPVGKWGIDQ